MITKTTTLRLRRVRFKNGNTIEVLRPKADETPVRLQDSVAAALEDRSGIVGYALVVWTADGRVTPAYYNGPRSPILAGQVPQYAKDVLLAEVATRWARSD